VIPFKERENRSHNNDARRHLASNLQALSSSEVVCTAQATAGFRVFFFFFFFFFLLFFSSFFFFFFFFFSSFGFSFFLFFFFFLLELRQPAVDSNQRW